MVQPMLCIAPEALDTVDVVSAFGLPFVLSDHDMASAKRERHIRMPVIGVIQASRCGVAFDEPMDNAVFSLGYREYPYYAIALQNTKDDDLAGGSPAASPGTLSSEGSLIALDRSTEGFSALLSDAEHSSDYSKEPFNCRTRYRTSETKTIRRYSQYEVFEDLTPCTFRDPERIPEAPVNVSRSTTTALKTTVAQCPGPMVATGRA